MRKKLQSVAFGGLLKVEIYSSEPHLRNAALRDWNGRRKVNIRTCASQIQRTYSQILWPIFSRIAKNPEWCRFHTLTEPWAWPCDESTTLGTTSPNRARASLWPVTAQVLSRNWEKRYYSHIASECIYPATCEGTSTSPPPRENTKRKTAWFCDLGAER